MPWSPGLSRIDAADVAALTRGVSLLGSGGGGDAATFAHVLRRRLRSAPLEVRDPGELGDALVVPVGVVGATRLFGEKLPEGTEFVMAVGALIRWTGARPAAVMSLEVGGLNGLSGPVAALDLGLPFVDADLMGRAMPRLDQFTWAACGQPVTPCAMREPGGPTLLVDGADASGLERSARALLAESGGWAALALPPIPASLVRERCVTGGLARACDLGRVALDLGSGTRPEALAGALGSRLLASGRVLDVGRHAASGGFGRGSVTVVDGEDSAVVRLEAENEYLLALRDGEPVATCPDLLCVVDRRTGVPLAVDEVRPGNEVLVLALPGPSWWPERGRLDRVGPRAFGIDAEPILIGQP
ncbi:DUF917 domain-containing protein [Geodermatophilus sp. DSM 44513]|uniref:DUF917 domain-containing protein n=1 Tax=Geodermatophilus sp. DSM 44513 TaxID=1528104 RepID=UPI00127FBCC5|nr:DUF917 domain-containing protein [Geodermatophilus sp. DSM 44513]WNV77795.1 DUF917 domain-containing protein [Geodermatophilus sp. DSM 44513]